MAMAAMAVMAAASTTVVAGSTMLAMAARSRRPSMVGVVRIPWKGENAGGLRLAQPPRDNRWARSMCFKSGETTVTESEPYYDTTASAVEQGEYYEPTATEVEGQYYESTATEVEGQYYDTTATEVEGQYYEQETKATEQPPAEEAYAEEPPAEEAPPPYYDNRGKPLNFIALGRAMQLKLDSQKDFDMLLEKCNAYGVMLPEEPSNIRRKLHELDPKETWIVVDSRAVMKFARKLAMEEADKGDYPPGFVDTMLNTDKYGKYDDEQDY